MRSYDKPHTLILLDLNYKSIFEIFRTLRFMRFSIHTMKNLKDVIPDLR